MIETIRTKMFEALKNGDKEKKQVYSNILNALTNKAKELRKETLTDTEASEVIVKLVKTLKESIDTCPKDRTDIKEKLLFELNIVKEYMPKQMTDGEIKAVICAVLQNLNIEAPTMKDKGKIMKDLMPKIKGKADGKLVNHILESFLQ